MAFVEKTHRDNIYVIMFHVLAQSKFTNSRTKNYNFTFTQVPWFTQSRVKNFNFTFSRQKKGPSTRSRNPLGVQLYKYSQTHYKMKILIISTILLYGGPGWSQEESCGRIFFAWVESCSLGRNLVRFGKVTFSCSGSVQNLVYILNSSPVCSPGLVQVGKKLYFQFKISHKHCNIHLVYLICASSAMPVLKLALFCRHQF